MEEKKQYIKNFSPKDDVDCFFLVKYINLVEGRDGRTYLNIILADATGEIEARMWGNPDKVYKHVSKGDVVRAEGKINLYQNRKQFVISRLERLDHELVDLSGLTAASKISPDDMMVELLELVQGNTNDVFIRELLLNILNDSEIKQKLLIWPAGKSIHHSYQSGLLEHILSCSKLSIFLSAHYNVNVNYVLAGSILHDLCKIFELSDPPNTDYTLEGKLIGHLVSGIQLVEDFSKKIPKFPSDLKIHLKHILLSHHGELAHGSPKLPQTLEAMLVHLIDLTDSRMNSMAMARETDNAEGDWTSFIKHLDRVVYRPELPFYPSIAEKQISAPVAKLPKENSTSRPGQPLKQSLGKLLEGVKINSDQS